MPIRPSSGQSDQGSNTPGPGSGNASAAKQPSSGGSASSPRNFNDFSVVQSGSSFSGGQSGGTRTFATPSYPNNGRTTAINTPGGNNEVVSSGIGAKDGKDTVNTRFGDGGNNQYDAGASRVTSNVQGGNGGDRFNINAGNTDSRNNMVGGAGNDVFNVDTGNKGSVNSLDGGAGNDTLNISGTNEGTTYFDGGTGTNQVNLQGDGWAAQASDNKAYPFMYTNQSGGRGYFRNTNINVNSPNGNVQNP